MSETIVKVQLCAATSKVADAIYQQMYETQFATKTASHLRELFNQTDDLLRVRYGCAAAHLAADGCPVERTCTVIASTPTPQSDEAIEAARVYIASALARFEESAL